MNWCPTTLTRGREDFALGRNPLLTVILLRSPPGPHGRLPWSTGLVIAPILTSLTDVWKPPRTRIGSAPGRGDADCHPRR